MAHPLRFLALTSLLLLSLFALSAASAAYYDPPERVAYLSHSQGDVSYSPAGEEEWFGVVRNRPLIRGDRLWTDRGARAEVQVGSAAVRLGSNTSIEFLDLADDIAQIGMMQGTLNLSVRRLYSGQTLEVATPTLAFAVDRAGRYRIDVDPRNGVTTVVVWRGAGEAYGDNSSFPLRAGDAVRFYDADLRDYEMYALPREDAFDRYCRDRDRRLARSASLRYVDDDLVGYADLDEYGSWQRDSQYGNVWFPNRVDPDWAPYRDGHWVWQEPWGWSWVDHAPWGFAPSHYGRWVNRSNRWGWVPGRRNARPVYAPALVAFLGGSGWGASISIGGDSPIGWFPLGPRDVYVPSYQASRDYFTRVNVNNTVINNTIINNVYNNYSSGTINTGRTDYAYRTVAGAVTAVPRSAFVNARPVRQAVIRLDRSAVASGEITRVAPIAPSARSVIGAAASGARPPREAFDRRVFVRNAPPPAERPFAAREQQLQKTPGRAPEAAAGKPVPGREDDTARKVRVIGQQRGAVDARAAGSRRDGGKPGPAGGAPLRPLDRSVEPPSGPVPTDQGRDKAQQESLRDALQKRQDAEKQEAERKRQVETQQQEQRRRDELQQKEAAEKQQAERKRQIEAQQQEQRRRDELQQKEAAEKQQAERKRQVETQQQEQRRRDELQQKEAAEKQQAERRRQIETQQQEQRRRDELQQKEAAEKQQIERRRQIETQQQEQRRRDELQQKEAAEKQQIERGRQIEIQQQEQLRRDAQQQKEAAEKRQGERERQTGAKQETRDQRDARQREQAAAAELAECERQARLKHQDVSQCKREPPPEEPGDDPGKDKNRR